MTLGPLPANRHIALSNPLALVAALLAGAALGGAIALTSPLLVLSGLSGAAAAVGLLRSTRFGLLALIGVVTLLPFAVIPLRLGVQATFLDATVGALLLVWLLSALHRRETFRLTAPGVWLGCFLLVALATFFLAFGQLAFDELTRRVIKLIASLLVFFCVVNTVRTLADVLLLQRALIASTTLAAGIAVGIWALPRAWQVRLLSSLGPLGYPTGDAVLRFVPGENNTYTDTLRAVGTSIDPNVLGGLLMLAAALVAAHLLDKQPLAPRWLLAPALAVLVAGLALSQSRSSWLGLAAAVGYLAVFRSRKALLLGLLGLAALTLTPFGQSMLERLSEGFAARDKASELRLEEYRNAFAIIRRYPLLGIGFGAAPDIDLHEGVSSLYLTLAEQTGLIGTALYLLALASAALAAFRARAPAGSTLGSSLAALQAALLAALVAGLLDHYFVNKDFPHMVALFWLYVGLLVAASSLARRESGGTDDGRRRASCR